MHPAGAQEESEPPPSLVCFAAWGRGARAVCTNWRAWVKHRAMALIGVLLAFIAALVNGLVNMQPLRALPESAAALEALLIDQVSFTLARAPSCWSLVLR